jgi:hypothetical protein
MAAITNGSPFISGPGVGLPFRNPGPRRRFLLFVVPTAALEEPDLVRRRVKEHHLAALHAARCRVS